MSLSSIPISPFYWFSLVFCLFDGNRYIT